MLFDISNYEYIHPLQDFVDYDQFDFVLSSQMTCLAVFSETPFSITVYPFPATNSWRAAIAKNYDG